MKLMVLEQQVNDFINSNFYYGTEEYSIALNNLLEEVDRSETLVPITKLLVTEDVNCQLAGSWIAAMMGEKSIEIFNCLKELLYSKNPKIRYEVCECYLLCANSGFLVTEFLKCIDDDEVTIRLRVIDYIKFLSREQLLLAYNYTKTRNELSYIHSALSICISQINHSITNDKIDTEIIKGTKIEKVAWFICAIKIGKSTNQLFQLAQLSNEPDIQEYFEIFINEE